MRRKLSFGGPASPLALILLLGLALLSGGQTDTRRPPPLQPPSNHNNDDWATKQAEQQRGKALNKERQAELRRDTDKLYQLASELKQAVDRSSENTLSLDVIRKSEQIEKLAKNVKEKMKAW